MENAEDQDDPVAPEADGSRWTRVLPALVGALICTGLIIEAIVTVVHGRGNGDLMVIVCPILGSIFLSIPAAQAWWMVIQKLKKP